MQCNYHKIRLNNINLKSDDSRFTGAFINVYQRYRLLALQEHDKIKNRSKLDIIYDILVSATGGVKKTHIMSHANLSSEQMNYYFNTLLSHSLLNAERLRRQSRLQNNTQRRQVPSLLRGNKVTYRTSSEVRMRSDQLFL